MRLLVVVILVAALGVLLFATSRRDDRAPRSGRNPTPPAVPAAPVAREEPKKEAAPQAHQPAMMGRVVDRDGRPIEGAVVRCNDMDATKPWEELPHSVTDAEGRFRRDAAASMHELIVSAAGYGERYLRSYPDDPDLRIVMEPPCTLAGVIRTPDGRPVAGAEITFWDSLIAAESDADGRFEVTGLRAGAVAMHAYWDGPIVAPRAPDTWWHWDWHFDLEPGEARRGLALTLHGARYSWLPLELVDDKGEPIAGARIVDTGTMDLLDESGDENLEEDVPVTNADGYVLLRAPDPIGYAADLEISHGGWTWRRRAYTVAPGTKSVVTLTLPPPLKVTFRLRDEAGHPIPATAGPHVELDGPVGDLAQPAGPLTFLVDAAPSRFFEYEVSARGYAIERVRRWSPRPHVEIRLRREARLRGRLVNLGGRSLRVYLEHGYGRPRDDGSFEIAGLPPGRAVLRVTERFRGRLHARRVVTLLEGDNDIGEIRLTEPAVVRGRVIDADGRGLGGARLQVLEPGWEGRDVGVSRPDGQFEFTAHRSKMLRIVARKPGLTSAAVPLGQDLLVRPSPTIRFRSGDVEWSRLELRTAEGHALRLVRLSLHWSEDRERFILRNIPRGTWRLALIDRRVATHLLPVQLEPGRIFEVDLR